MEYHDKPIVICAIAKNEHLYINDWVKYHINLGFDHIYVFDNDDLNAQFMGDFIDKDLVDKISFIDVRGMHKQWFQQECYNKFYQENKDNFAWCAFIDIDEYIVLQDWKSIKEMLSDNLFKSVLSIKLHWHMFGDENTIKRDLSIPVNEFFKTIIWDENKKLWWQGKQITKGGLIGAEIHNHNCFIDNKIIGQVTADGLPCVEENEARDLSGNVSVKAYLNHYMTKTLDEFLNQKMGRSDAMFAKRLLNCDYFWQLNEKTPEKLKYIQNWMDTHNYG